MTVSDILKQVSDLSNPKYAQILNEDSKTSDKIYAVGLTKLRVIARKAKRDHERALELWSSGVHEGKLLATLTEEPKKVTSEQLDKQVKEIHSFELADYFAKNVVAKTVFLLEKANDWTSQHQPEFVRRVGYACVCVLAKSSKTLDNNYFVKHLTIIELEIQKATNWVKEGQNYALIAIGSRNQALNTKALKVADIIGDITIDYGNTSCKTTDAFQILSSEKIQKRL